MSELLSCPFCGGKAVVVPGLAGSAVLDKQTFHVGCRGCKTEQPYKLNESEAVAAWNRRALPPPLDLEAVARIIAGPMCDADGLDHDVVQQGRYRFCAKCGETLTGPTISHREALSKADQIIALSQPSTPGGGGE